MTLPLHTSHDITVYTAGRACAQCVATKRVLDRAGVLYTTVDATDPAVIADLKSRGFTALPVVTSGADSWSGFRPDRLAAAARRAAAA